MAKAIGSFMVFAPVFFAGMLCGKYPLLAAFMAVIPIVLIEWATHQEKKNVGE